MQSTSLPTDQAPAGATPRSVSPSVTLSRRARKLVVQSGATAVTVDLTVEFS